MIEENGKKDDSVGKQYLLNQIEQMDRLYIGNVRVVPLDNILNIIENSKKGIEIDKCVGALTSLQAKYPDTKIIIETPDGMCELHIGDAVIYVSVDDDLVIDSE